ncbi:hypothetical protein ACQKP0_17570 [Heyndrickxia sp. NPDC080065]
MDKEKSKKECFFDEEGVEKVSNQIMGAYASGVVDQPDGQFHIYDQEKDE